MAHSSAVGLFKVMSRQTCNNKSKNDRRKMFFVISTNTLQVVYLFPARVNNVLVVDDRYSLRCLLLGYTVGLRAAPQPMQQLQGQK